MSLSLKRLQTSIQVPGAGTRQMYLFRAGKRAEKGLGAVAEWLIDGNRTQRGLSVRRIGECECKHRSTVFAGPEGGNSSALLLTYPRVFQVAILGVSYEP
jgi:hypothetical protein